MPGRQPRVETIFPPMNWPQSDTVTFSYPQERTSLLPVPWALIVGMWGREDGIWPPNRGGLSSVLGAGGFKVLWYKTHRAATLWSFQTHTRTKKEWQSKRKTCPRINKCVCCGGLCGAGWVWSAEGFSSLQIAGGEFASMTRIYTGLAGNRVAKTSTK